MRSVQVIVGRKVACYHCGKQIRLVLIPAVKDKWQPCEDFEELSDHLEMHDCPKYPGKPSPIVVPRSA